MVTAATVPVQDDFRAADVLLKADKALASTMLTGWREPKGDWGIRHDGAETITPNGPLLTEP